MTEKEAVEIIKQVPLYRYECELEKGRRSDLFEALSLSIELLEKQIPKKPIYSKFDDNGFEEIIPYKAECPICGQKIDWNK